MLKPENLTNLSPEEFLHFISEISPAELESHISHLDHEKIKLTISQIQKEKDPKWKQKIRSAIIGLNDRTQLEVASSQISADQFIELIDKTLQIEDKHQWKLFPIIVGMSFDTFVHFLSRASPQHLTLLQHESVTEPIQHKLTTLTHEIGILIKQIEIELERFYDQIEQINIEEMARDDIFEVHHRIGLYAEFFEIRFQQASKALAIAWNTNRLDLIESLSKIKDTCHKYNLYGVGLPRDKNTVATGLYQRLESKLFSIYGYPNISNDREAMHDDEPAIEALVKFSMWYLRDYWELGLLPSVKNSEELDLGPSAHLEGKGTRLRENLFSEAKQRLESVGLNTVADLKNAYIFSKKTLQTYLKDSFKI